MLTLEEAQDILERIDAKIKEGNPPGCLGATHSFMVPMEMMRELVLAWKALRDKP